ncbi:hypothetical protein B0O99DRAFT_330335 [Bisporella sp. PMI_857]|nr:hypothetical protein B0O99DRAFT_330335 [Bisporella sp. PMI_857]
MLKSDPNITRTQLREYGFANCPAVPVAERQTAIYLAIRVMLMIYCSAEAHSANILEHGLNPIIWLADAPFSTFVEEAFSNSRSSKSQ